MSLASGPSVAIFSISSKTIGHEFVGHLLVGVELYLQEGLFFGTIRESIAYLTPYVPPFSSRMDFR